MRKPTKRSGTLPLNLWADIGYVTWCDLYMKRWLAKCYFIKQYYATVWMGCLRHFQLHLNLCCKIWHKTRHHFVINILFVIVELFLVFIILFYHLFIHLSIFILLFIHSFYYWFIYLLHISGHFILQSSIKTINWSTVLTVLVTLR
jgi:hypothetical protein